MITRATITLLVFEIASSGIKTAKTFSLITVIVTRPTKMKQYKFGYIYALSIPTEITTISRRMNTLTHIPSHTKHTTTAPNGTVTATYSHGLSLTALPYDSHPHVLLSSTIPTMFYPWSAVDPSISLLSPASYSALCLRTVVVYVQICWVMARDQ